jgi:hypothetical protein
VPRVDPDGHLENYKDGEDLTWESGLDETVTTYPSTVMPKWHVLFCVVIDARRIIAAI